jgi:hypothetical protein
MVTVPLSASLSAAAATSTAATPVITAKRLPTRLRKPRASPRGVFVFSLSGGLVWFGRVFGAMRVVPAEKVERDSTATLPADTRTNVCPQTWRPIAEARLVSRIVT